MHVGGARTALFNWLFARRRQGKFILRIEDTDRTRSTEDAVRAIIDSLKWLGINWDEGPYRQTERLRLYQQAAEKLLAAGKAYYCYCSAAELDERRRAAIKAGRPPGYDRRCRDLSPMEQEKWRAAGRRPSIRFKSPDEGQIVIDDIIRGRVVFARSDLDDLIIVRPDGTATYNLAVVIDDAELGITHVIRGEDHLSNTPRQIQLYEALGYDVPRFAHLSMILGPDKTRLSKRHGATSVEVYRDQGYLPEAMVNYLALLGWSYDDKTTVFHREELIDKFSLAKVGKAAAVFDQDKLKWLNGVYIRKLTAGQLVERLSPVWRRAGLLPENIDRNKLTWLREIATICQERLTLLTDVLPMSDFFFTEVIEYDPVAIEKVIKGNAVVAELPLVTERLSSLKVWETEEIEKVLRSLAAELEVKPGKLFQPIRVAVTGRRVSPPLFETLWLLGREKSLKRLKAAVKAFVK